MNDRQKVIVSSINEHPSAPQIRAANPQNHVWVRASAGSGKTTVLVNRVLRLMLPDRVTKQRGTPPEKILCITYTKAGATNMALRIQNTLLSWSVKPDDELKKDLRILFDDDVDDSYLRFARELFIQILDKPERLKIMTIHSFCQSVLARFPLETGLSPTMQVIEEYEAAQLKQTAFDSIITSSNALLPQTKALLFKIPYERLQSIINTLLSNVSYIDTQRRIKNYYEHYANAYGVTVNNLNIALQNFVSLSKIDDKTLYAVSKGFRSMQTEATIKHADQLEFYRLCSDEERLKNLDEFVKIMTKKPSHKALKEDPDFMNQWQALQDKYELFLKLQELNYSAAFRECATAIYHTYQNLKAHNNQLDYNDLIVKTKSLLESSYAWVHFKLDGGIDHILLDESQDTSPDQWDIIRALTSEMLAGKDDKKDRPRSLFVVGDDKQSIFSFQGADPQVSHEMFVYFKNKIEPLQDGLEEKLIYSFRSAEPILNVVDEVFSVPGLKHAIGLDPDELLLHRSYRKNYKNHTGGAVELWLETTESIKKDQSYKKDIYSWVNVLDVTKIDQTESADKKLLGKLTMRIKQEIISGNWQPQDILILFRSRNDMMNNLIKMLKWNDIPVSGMDRLILNDHIVIQDIIALAKFIVMEEDDFSLACFLKSPFIGMSEDELFTLAYNRGTKTLFECLNNNSSHAPITSWLNTLIELSNTVPVYELLMHILIAPCPADPMGSGYKACTARFGSDIMDPLDEIVGDALRLELNDIRTLPDFIARFTKGKRDIKRELSEAMGEVRVMTVHASKGLEAPVVILADTITVPNHKKTGRVFLDTETNLPIVNTQSDKRSLKMEEARTHALNKSLEEEKRLLYVAMTRAEDVLIVAGAYKATEKKPKPADQSWYTLVENAFDRMNVPEIALGMRRLGQSTLIKQAHKNELNSALQSEVEHKIPAWVHQNPPPIPKGQSVLNPSLAKRDQKNNIKNTVFEPHKADHQERFLRGNITHLLLQILPDINKDKQKTIAETYLARGRFALSPALQQDIIKETLAILNHPDFAKVFGEGSLAEVPIMGHLPSGDYVSGQIDRLYIGKDEILVVDYKTNRPSPDNPSDIPQNYSEQLALYKALLAVIYPTHQIKTALLWTDKTCLMPVSV